MKSTLVMMETNTVIASAPQITHVVLTVWPWGLLTATAAFFFAMMIQRVAGSFALSSFWQMAPGHWAEKVSLANPAAYLIWTLRK
jgi:hypothetical protein